MKNFQIVVKGTHNNTPKMVIFYKNEQYDHISKLPREAGYDTISAAKRISTMVFNNPEKYGFEGWDVQSTGAINSEKMMLSIEYRPLYKDQDEDQSKGYNKELVNELMEKYYPEKEAAIRAEHGQEPLKAKEDTKEGQGKGKKKRVATPRKPADPTMLTEKQLLFLTEIRKDGFYEKGLESSLYIPVLVDTLEDTMNYMTVGAMVSTLREKGLIVVGVSDAHTGKKMKYFEFTELGKQVMIKYNLA